ncbi:MAG: MoxR family ATPase [Acidobacteria bacterium]|nr:MoxR family ATPase [Acidobacteriota bacterium]
MAAPDTSLPMVSEQLQSVRDEIGKVIVGHEDVVEGVLTALISGGHVLLEGVPGLGKTTLLRTLGEAMHLNCSRIQFTPDLMPADILGSMVMHGGAAGERALRFEPGPIFANLVLADEINRATPRTQSALLEAMQERTVTTGNETHGLENPFLVMATQNPLEMEGTYPLPEAQLDRFLLKILVPYPNRAEMQTIADRTMATLQPSVRQTIDQGQVLEIRRQANAVLVAPHVRDFAIDLVLATQPESAQAHEVARKYVRYGASPRGVQALLQCGRVRALFRGRLNVSEEDVRSLAGSALRHRIILNFDAHAEGKTEDDILQVILESLDRKSSG